MEKPRCSAAWAFAAAARPTLRGRAFCREALGAARLLDRNRCPPRAGADKSAAQPADYREDILPDVSNREILRVSIEAGTTYGWERYTGLHGLRIGIDRFGVSAPAKDAYDYFGLTPDKIASRVLDHMKQREIA